MGATRCYRRTSLYAHLAKRIHRRGRANRRNRWKKGDLWQAASDDEEALQWISEELHEDRAAALVKHGSREQ